MPKRHQIAQLRQIIRSIAPADLVTEDRLALIELLRDCLAADRAASTPAVDGAAPEFVEQFVSAHIAD